LEHDIFISDDDAVNDVQIETDRLVRIYHSW